MSVPILVVEHEPRYAERMKEALKTRPVELLFARDGEEALQVIDQRQPKLVILSSVIPKVSTADLIRQIKARPAGASTSILITVSGYTGKNPKGDAMRLGADDIIPKPFMDAFFADKVTQLVETSGPKLTSDELFGDLLADKPATKHVKRATEEDVNKLLEQTLTGLKIPGFQKKKTEQETPPAIPVTPKPHPHPASNLDRLVEDTLSGLEKSVKHKPRVAPAPAPTAPPPPEEKIMASSAVIESSAVQPVQEELEEESGNRFGQYTMVERIARGGMAEVWKAKMSGVEGFEKIVAIKKILPHLSDDSEFVNMFVDEAKLAAQLNHNNIIHIYDFGKIGNSYYIAMEYVDGHDLKDILKQAETRDHPMPMELGLFIASKVAAALDYAHRKRDFAHKELGVVHRDVSPQNVLISDEGDIKLCDFGIAKATSKVTHTQAGALKGKLHYMSPEQAWGKPIDRRSDVFALATVLFEMLTGRRLFSGDNEISVLEQVREARVKAPSTLNDEVTAEIDRMVLKALQREPEARYQTAGEMARDIDSVLYSFRPTPTSADLAIYLDRLYTSRAEVAVIAPAPEPPVAPPPRPAEPPRIHVTPPVAGSIVASAAPTPHSDAGMLTAKAPPKKGRALILVAGALLLAAVAVGAVVMVTRRQPGAAQQAALVPRPAAPAPTQTRAVPPPPISATAPAEEIVPVTDTAADQELINQEVQRRIAAERARIGEERTQRLAAEESAAQRRAAEELAARQRERLLAEQRERELAAAAAASRSEAQPSPTPRVEEASTQPTSVDLAATATVEEPRPTEPPPSQQSEIAEPATRQVREGELVDAGTPGLVEPELLGLKKVAYPPIAKLQKISGVVVISALVSENGRVLEARVLRGVARGADLNEAALEMVRGATFRPATKDGVRVKAYKTMVVPFKL